MSRSAGDGAVTTALAERPALAPRRDRRAVRGHRRAPSAPGAAAPTGPDRDSRPVRLALIGGQRLLREATASLLVGAGELEVRGTFGAAADYLATPIGEPPDVLLLDCEAGVDWQADVELLAAAECGSRIVLMCATLDQDAVRYAVEDRVSGVLSKDCALEEIREAIAYVATGRAIMPAGWQRLCDPTRSGPVILSPRQTEVLALIADGRRTLDIAAELELSPNTVKFHIRALYERLGVHNRVEAANRYGAMNGSGA